MHSYTFILFLGLISLPRSISTEIKSTACPDGKSSCPDGETCCQLGTGQYGCCPIPNAVCCSDHEHCCPNGYTCDVEHSRCRKGFTGSLEIVCPSGDVSCTNGETCCLLSSGDYGCCPLADAVCCSDNSHCCPHGYKCNIEQNKCEKTQSIKWFEKKPAIPIKSTLSAKLLVLTSMISYATIQCPDETSFCPEETTCCQLKDKSFGCCPHRDGICCDDQIHCCAKGYVCDKSSSRCIQHLSFFNQTQVRLINFIDLHSNQQRTCPDGITNCSINSTCCQNHIDDKNTYSCCPYSQGVCCGLNGSYCCPHKYICDETNLSCQLNEKDSLKQCESSNFACPINKTCCKTSNYQDHYACCDFEQGVCCSNGKYCCPKGSICNEATGGCIKT